ncbi:hypothetical protein CI109_103378 [Kwoniella shandongensis]|uniref:Uncharacterized protein n=1 Tax=Kwoniella shandongensis TaxID=1734106 RepID=A0A5M6BWB7_9TREE|nr:uncharacterized protein CI109_004459 [Kwoniella shandongensis]KAA5527167.1 hypothetical protein CI109_004459 [Kwoniella shandongensis]
MGLLSRRSNEYNADGTVSNGHHHPKRDAALAGAAAHHESNTHPGRNTALAAGTVGGVEHHKNHETVTGHNSTANPYANGNATVGNGYGGVNHNGTHTGTTAGTAGTAGAGLGAANGINGHGTAPPPVAGAGQVNTGPAPLHGVSSGTTPSIKAAAKLERKGKLESTMGGLLCSSSLKHKSEAHLAQADHLRMQASELSEAERLEHEAGMRRQRAVGLGADPVHASGRTGHGPTALTA